MEDKKWKILKKKFNTRSHACQELGKMVTTGKISNYRVSWNTQLNMVVEIKTI